MPEPKYGLPTKVVKTDDGLNTVFYADGTKRQLEYLGRQDVMRVAGAIAASRGEKSPGIRGTNGQLAAWVFERMPWEADPNTPAPAPKPDKPNVDFHLPAPNPRTGKFHLTCGCGHVYPFNIKGTEQRKKATGKWLSERPCPTCQRGGVPLPDKKDETPKPKPAHIPMPKGEVKHEVVLQGIWHNVQPTVIRLAGAGIHQALVGGPGTGKSEIFKVTAKALDLPFYSQSCHPLMSEATLFGYRDANGNFHETPLYHAVKYGGVFCLDEADNGHHSLTAGLNQLLANRVGVFGGEMVPMHEDTIIGITMNTLGDGPEAGFIGRMGMDKATKDRFVTLGVPIDPKLELALITGETFKPLKVQVTEREWAAGEAKQLQETIDKVRQSIKERGLTVIVSPRVTIHCAKMVKAGFTLEESLRMTALRDLDETTTKGILGEVL